MFSGFKALNGFGDEEDDGLGLLFGEGTPWLEGNDDRGAGLFLPLLKDGRLRDVQVDASVGDGV